MRYIRISCPDEGYCAFPDVVRTAHGRLVCAYREGDGHVARVYSHLVLRTSDDGGERWSDPRILAHHDAGDDLGGWESWNCPRLARLRDGLLVLCCDYVRRLRPDAAELAAEAETFLWWSGDEGETWDGPRPTGVHGIVPDRVTETRAGTLLLLSHREHPRTGVLAQYASCSDDGGRTWQAPVVVAYDGIHQLCEASEASVVQLRDEAGTLVCYLRENSGRGLVGYKSLSTDGSRTWQGPYPTALVGCHRPTAGLLASGAVLVTYGLLPGRWGNRDPHAALEAQGSAAEAVQALQRVALMALDHDAHPEPDGGYSGWVQLPDGAILCTYYIKDDQDNAQIRAVRFREEEIRLG